MKTSEKLARAMCNNIIGTDALWQNFVPLVKATTSCMLEEIATEEMYALVVDAYQDASEKLASKEGIRAAIKAIKEKLEEE